MFTHIRVSTSRFPITRSVRLTSRRVAGVVAVTLLLGVLAHPAQAQEKMRRGGGAEMRLNLIDAKPGVVAIHPDSGWQITAILQAKNNRLLGIGVPNYPPIFPHANVTGYLVFKDPDNCPSFLDFAGELMTYESYYCYSPSTESYPGCIPPYWPDDDRWPTGLPRCAPPEEGARVPWVDAISESGVAWQKDETWVEITPGLSIPTFIPTFTSNEDGPEKEQPPVVWTGVGGDEERDLASVGPSLGSTDDDTRSGSWRRCPAWW